VRQRVVFFTKHVDTWREYYAGCANVEVRPTGEAFLDVLSRSSGLVASPSPGAVIQAPRPTPHIPTIASSFQLYRSFRITGGHLIAHSGARVRQAGVPALPARPPRAVV